MRRLLQSLTISLLLTGLSLLSSPVRATHIVGAELFYVCIDSVTNTYQVSLKLYRDCLAGQAQYDNSIDLFVFNGLSGSLFNTFSILKPPLTPLIPLGDIDDCLANIPTICVEEGIYSKNIILPPAIGGYDLAWARCCRNAAIDNLTSPLSQGVTFLAHVPSTLAANCNSMPQFNQFPPIFLCVNQPFNFDHSATDPDADSLTYAITDPYLGINTTGLGAGNPNFGGPDPVVDPFINPMGPPPYQTVNFAPGYGFANPFGSGNFNIDPQTGFITVTPNQTGIFVFSISVFEYRNGILLSENRRDFQIHVLTCLPQGAPPVITHDLSLLNTSGDTIIIFGNKPFCYPVTVVDSFPTDSLQAFTVSAAFGNGTFTPPLATFSWSGKNPIVGQVCWTPSCAYKDQVIALIVGAKDKEDCETVADVFDTVWVKVLAPINIPPQITPNYAGLNISNDTITILATDSFCYSFTILDSNQFNIITPFTSSPIFNSANPPSFTFSGSNPVTGQICWVPDCSLKDQVVEISFGATDDGICNVIGQDQSTVYIHVIVPPNQPPGITTDLTSTVFSNDSIFIPAESNFCFNFLITDPDVGDVISFQTFSSIFNQPGGPSINVIGTNPLVGTICWTPDCNKINQVFPLIFGGQDPGVCDNEGKVRDTVYVVVQGPDNVPPIISPDLSLLPSSNDTIIINANRSFCFPFTITDLDLGDSVLLTSSSPIFNDPNPPVLTFSGTNPITGQICWQPSCDYANQVISFILKAKDNGECGGLEAFDTVYVLINVPPNQPPIIQTNLAALTTINDTIIIDALDSICYPIVFSDFNSIDTLTAFALSPQFGTGQATLTWTGINPLTGQVCFKADCADEGQLIRLIIGVQDNGQCDNEMNATDTVYIRVNQPVKTAPVISTNLSGTNYVGNTIFVEVSDSFCYSFVIRDLTPDKGFLYSFEFQNLAGTNLNLGSWNVQQVGDSLIGTACFFADCSNGGSRYRMIIIARDEARCPPFPESRDTVYVKVNTSFLSFAGNDTSFCEGSGGAQLFATPIGGVAPYYYSWTCSPVTPSGCGLSSPYVQNPTANPSDTTTYLVQITDKNGCTSEVDGIVVNVLQQPVVDAGPDTGFCEYSAGVHLKGTILNAGAAPGPYTWQWLPAAGLNGANFSNPFATPDTTTIYTLIVTSSNGCNSLNTTLDSLSTVEVTVNPRPSAVAGPDQDLCFRDTLLLYGFASNAGPNYQYVWTPSTGLVDSSKQATYASPDKTTTYFLVTWSNGCPSVADSVTINVHTLPTIQTGLSYETCWADSVQITGVAGGDVGTQYFFDWSPHAGLSDPHIPKPWASPDSSTTYTLIASSEYDCVSDPYEVTVHVLPAPLVDAGRDTLLCRGDTIALSANVVTGGGSTDDLLFYQWTPTDGLIGNPFAAQLLTSPDQSQVYTLSVSLGPCSDSDIIRVDVFDAVQASIAADTSSICSGDSVILTALGGKGSAIFSWDPPLSLNNPGSATPHAAPDTTTLYTVTIREGGCEGIATFKLQVFPTPVGDYFYSEAEGCVPMTVSFIENTETGQSFIWDFGDGSPVSNEAGMEHLFTEPGSYPVTLTAVGAGGCSTLVSLTNIVVHERGNAHFGSDPPNETDILLPDAEVSFIDASKGAVAWYWDFGDNSFSSEQYPTHSYYGPGEYLVTLIITDEGGCTDSVTHRYRVLAPEFDLPNVFTPNGDGINDNFTLSDYDGKEAFEMTIFDRWGRTVAANITTVSLGWDGRWDDGKHAVGGVYFYVIVLGEQSYQGTVTLMR